MSNPVIRVEHLSKQYRLGQVGTGTISHDLNRWWHRIRGNEDPYLKIGETNDRTVKGESEYVWALRDVDFAVKQGEILGVIGRNGAGKSTLLKILSRTTAPTTGSVKIRGRVASLLEVGTGFHPELSGRENVYLNGTILGMTRKEIEKKFDEIVDFSGVERYIDTPVKRYSSGMYVRLAFAVAAHLESEILIVDEVLAVGDVEFQKKCLGKMGEVSKGAGKTILFVSHNMSAIKNLCNKSLIMINGTVNFEGPVETGISNYLNAFRVNELSNNYTGEEQHDTHPVILKSARLENIHGEETADFECDDDIIIIFELSLSRVIKGLYGYLELKNSTDEISVQTDTFDFLPNILEGLPAGEHRFKVRVPKRILPRGKHYVYLNFASSFEIEKFSLGPGKEILSINISDSHTMRGNTRSAATGSILQWEKI